MPDLNPQPINPSEVEVLGSYTRAVAADPHGTTFTCQAGTIYEVIRVEVDGNANEAAGGSAIVILEDSANNELYRVQAYYAQSDTWVPETPEGVDEEIGPFTVATVINLQTTTLASTSGTPICCARMWIRQAVRTAATT